MNSSVQKPVQGILEGNSMKNEFNPFILTDAKQDVHILLNPVMLLFVKQLFIYNLKKCPKKGHFKKYSCMPSITTLCAAGFRENFFQFYQAILITQSLTWEISIEK